MMTVEERAKVADALSRAFAQMGAQLEKASTLFAELEKAASPKPQQRHTMRAALEANARPAWRPQQARRIRRSQHR